MKTHEAIDVVSKEIIKSGLARAIVVKGSIGRGDDDEYSDVDLYAIACKDRYQPLLERRIQFLEAYCPLVYHSEENFGLQQMIGIYNNGLHFDFYVATDPEEMGTLDPVKVIFDPEGLFQNYAPTRSEMEFDELVEHFNTVLYEFVEADSAYQRQNYPWSGHILSNAIANCAILLRWRYDKKYAFLGLKKINEILPEEEYQLLEEAYQLLHKCNFQEANQRIVAMLKIFYSERTKEEMDKLDNRFYQWILDQINISLFQDS